MTAGTLRERGEGGAGAMPLVGTVQDGVPSPAGGAIEGGIPAQLGGGGLGGGGGGGEAGPDMFPRTFLHP
jgi:hypothetical protein